VCRRLESTTVEFAKQVVGTVFPPFALSLFFYYDFCPREPIRTSFLFLTPHKKVLNDDVEMASERFPVSLSELLGIFCGGSLSFAAASRSYGTRSAPP